MNVAVGIERIRAVMIVQSGEGVSPNVGIGKVIVERTARIVTVEVVVVWKTGAEGFGI